VTKSLDRFVVGEAEEEYMGELLSIRDDWNELCVTSVKRNGKFCVRLTDFPHDPTFDGPYAPRVIGSRAASSVARSANQTSA
jgi:hypothetical protein